jgi:hypothetical protein
MPSSLRRAVPDVPLKTLKVGLAKGETVLNSIESAGDTVQKALIRSGISQKEAALTMDINEGQLTRQLRGQEHLSWQRLFMLPDKFFLELLIILAEHRGIASVRTRIEFERRAV